MSDQAEVYCAWPPSDPQFRERYLKPALAALSNCAGRVVGEDEVEILPSGCIRIKQTKAAK